MFTRGKLWVILHSSAVSSTFDPWNVHSNYLMFGVSVSNTSLFNTNWIRSCFQNTRKLFTISQSDKDRTSKYQVFNDIYRICKMYFFQNNFLINWNFTHNSLTISAVSVHQTSWLKKIAKWANIDTVDLVFLWVVTWCWLVSQLENISFDPPK